MFTKMCTTTTVLALLLVLLVQATQSSSTLRPRGVSLFQSSLYVPRNDNTWVCLDQSKVISYVRINDDYCDCADGSDEPGTSACPEGRFHCVNEGHRSQEVPSSRVNDGICDCCDASDEWLQSESCSNTCLELGRAEQEQRKSEAELFKRGAAKRAEMITKGKQLKADREARRIELEKRRAEQDAVKQEKEDIKSKAEAAESEALELYKEQQREQDAEVANVEQDPQTSVVEAEANFVRFDTNKDGFIEITELQVDMTLDRDRNGVVTVEEAKYFLDERDRIDLDAFITLSWPRIKTAQMMTEGLFKPPALDGAEDDEHAELLVGGDNQIQNEGSESIQNQNADEEHDHDDVEPYEEIEGEDGEEDAYDETEEVEAGVGAVTEETATPDYDPETLRLVELANEARHAFSEVEHQIREIDNEIKEIDDQNAKDYGASEEYASMEGECYTFEDREYVYTLCPFERTAQKSRNGGAETTLGRWDRWESEGSNKYAKQKYSHGASCWNGPQRSALVHLKCSLENRITAVSEPNRCEYFFEFETPAACDAHNVSVSEGEQLHDEL